MYGGDRRIPAQSVIEPTKRIGQPELKWLDSHDPVEIGYGTDNFTSAVWLPGLDMPTRPPKAVGVIDCRA